MMNQPSTGFLTQAQIVKKWEQVPDRPSTSYQNTMGHSVQRLTAHSQQTPDQMSVLQNLSLKNAMVQKANMQANRRL